MVCQSLLQEGAKLHIFDPKANSQQFILEMKYSNLWAESFAESIKWFEDPYEASVKSHAIVILTEWDEFATYDYEKIYGKMSRPSFLFDGRQVITREKIENSEFEYSQMETLPTTNKKFVDLCKLYNEENRKFFDTVSNFLIHYKNSAIEKHYVLLNSASLLINSEKVAVCSDLNIKNQKLSSEAAVMKKTNSELFKISKLYQNLTNIVLTNKKGDITEDRFLGTYHPIGNSEKEYTENSKTKAIIFMAKRKKDTKNGNKWVIISEKMGEKGGKFSGDPPQFYSKCLKMFSSTS